MADYTLAFWNLENLFAPEGFAGRPAWLAQKLRGALAGWTPSLFTHKISQLAFVIGRLGGGRGPDLLGVCEVENRFVLEQVADALNRALPDRDYGLVHADAERDLRGVDTAFIYDRRVLEVDPDAVFSHFVVRRTGTRDITQATFATRAGNEFVALANHWPARTPGVLQTEGFRMCAAETLAYWHERIREIRGEDIPVIAMGDLNDDPFDRSLTVHARASRERGDIIRARSARFLNLSWQYFTKRVTNSAGRKRTVDGTLYFRGTGYVFDQLLVGPGFLKRTSPLRIVDNTAQIEAFDVMTSTRRSEGPIRFGLPKGNPAKNINRLGYSDHFPISVVVRES